MISTTLSAGGKDVPLSSVPFELFGVAPWVGTFGLALAVGVLYVVVSDWLEKRLFSQSGAMRTPTDEEADRLSRALGRDSVIGELPVVVLDGGQTTKTDSLAAPVGPPGRREFVIGADFLKQDDEFVRAVLTVQDSRLRTGLYDKRFVAALIRLEVLLVLLVYFLPPVPPAPDLQFGLAAIAASIVLLLGIDRWIRACVFESDRDAGEEYSAERIEQGLLDHANWTGASLSRSRLSEFFALGPSIEDRISKLRSSRKTH